MNRLVPLLLSAFALLPTLSRAKGLLDGDSQPIKRVTDLKQETFLDQLEGFQPLKSTRSILFIGDTAMPSRWDAHFRKAFQGAQHAPIIRLDTGSSKPLEGCRTQAYVEPPCLDALSPEAGRARVALLFQGFRRDTTLESRIQAVSTPVMVNGKMVNQTRWVSGPPMPFHHRAVEVVLIDRETRRLHYHARLVGSGKSPDHADADLGKQVAGKLEKVFRPGVGTDFDRRVVSVNPMGLALLPGTFLAFQAGFEKLLGTGKRSLVWDPVFFSYENEDRGIDYLFLPLVGGRQYFRTEGRGFFLAAKTGYLYQGDLGGISGMAIGQDDLEKNHLLAFLAGPGLSLSFLQVRLQASLALGVGLGMIQAWTVDWSGVPEEYGDWRFGARPVVNAGLGVGWAF